MARNYDSIKLKIQPAGTLQLPWKDFDRAVILINGHDFREIAQKEETKFYENQGKNDTGGYHSMSPVELYGYLSEADKYGHEEEVPVLTCTCDETGCSSVKITVIRTEYGVLWQDIHTYANVELNLSYIFRLKDYDEFMRQLKIQAEKQK